MAYFDTDLLKKQLKNEIDGFLNKYIFAQDQPMYFENDIKKLIKEIKVRPLKGLQVIGIILAFVLIRSFGRISGVFGIFMAVILAALIVGLIISMFISAKSRSAKKALQKALKNYKMKNFKLALDFLIDAYTLSKNEAVWNLILEYIQKHQPTAEQQNLITKIELEKDGIKYKKDKKLSEILQQISNVSNYIKKHSEIINTVINKIKELENQLNRVKDELLITEYQGIIKRYKDIIELEEAKIEFYTKTKVELHKLKENHLFTHKLLKEKEELKTLEDELLEKTITEQYSSQMSVSDFIIYENAYLDALKEYSEPISSSNSQNIFEEMTSSFKLKTKLM